jgi:hypothetical protein
MRSIKKKILTLRKGLNLKRAAKTDKSDGRVLPSTPPLEPPIESAASRSLGEEEQHKDLLAVNQKEELIASTEISYGTSISTVKASSLIKDDSAALVANGGGETMSEKTTEPADALLGLKTAAPMIQEKRTASPLHSPEAAAAAAAGCHDEGESPGLLLSYNQIPVLEQTKLPRGGVSVETKAVGRVQVSFIVDRCVLFVSEKGNDV